MKFIQTYTYDTDTKEVLQQQIIPVNRVVDIIPFEKLVLEVSVKYGENTQQVYYPVNWLDKHSNKFRGEGYATKEQDIYYIKAEDLHKLMI